MYYVGMVLLHIRLRFIQLFSIFLSLAYFINLNGLFSVCASSTWS